MKNYVYILQSNSHPDEFYTGLCENLEKRLADHNQGKSAHTSKHRPWRIVFHAWFEDPERAVAFEKYLKSGSGRAFASKRLR
ncbi:MAG: GIY-YIG nuclease family protein [Sphingomonadales bacterium]|nr:GIY-YIG nuclease family protein [Sphingomonadales bacterium]